MLTEEQKENLRDCRTDKELKKVFKKIASKEPEKFFPTKELKNLGYSRKKCENCGTHFWTVLQNRTLCGDPSRHNGKGNV